MLLPKGDEAMMDVTSRMVEELHKAAATLDGVRRLVIDARTFRFRVNSRVHVYWRDSVSGRSGVLGSMSEGVAEPVLAELLRELAILRKREGA